MTGKIRLKRVYDPVEPADGYRILADRLWPRGIRKEQLCPDEWWKALAPGNELRKAYHHHEMPFSEFAGSYLCELEENPEAKIYVERCREILKQGDITLLYAARTGPDNHASVLRNWLLKQL